MILLNVVLAGGSGFIGKYLASYFIRNSINVTILGRSNNDQGHIVCDGGIAKFIRTSYKEEELLNIFKGHNCIINLAGVRQLKLGVQEYSKYDSNVTVANAIFKAAYLCGIKNVIHFSSISVYSNSNKLPWKECDHPIPKNFYGLSKLNIDNMVEFYNKAFHMNIKSLRLAQVIGLGERKGYMLDTFFQNAYKKKPITIYGKGEGRRQYIYINDIVSLTYECLFKEQIQGIYNIGMPSNYSHLELATRINDIFENSNNIIIDEEKEEDCTINLMDISKARIELNWKPSWCLEDAVLDVKYNMSSRF